jgi:hypothetical protein
MRFEFQHSAISVLMFMAGVTIGSISIAANNPPVYDPKAWLQDLDQAQDAFATKYANLEWAVVEHEVDLAGLFADAKAQLQLASNDVDARAALDRLARRLGDGHVQFRWSKDQSSATIPSADCKALGYDARILGAPVAAALPGYMPLADAPANAFPAGTVQVADHKIGVIKIGIFTPQGLPDLCADALQSLGLSAQMMCDKACSDRIDTWVSNRMTRDLATQLRAVKNAGADVLLIDVANNGGGTEWAEAAVRMVTGVRLKSARVGFVRETHWVKSFAETEADLRTAAKRAPGKDRPLLLSLADKAHTYQLEAEIPCDSTPLWHGGSPTCHWLGQGFYASGLLDSADPNALRNKPWATDVFTPIQYSYEEGIWRGPVIVLVNARTASAAEQFAAELQDNHAAIVIGTPTVGAGCGHTNGGTPTTLKNSGGVLELPDCARFRADGSNEVMGIQPDVLVGLRAQDGLRRQGIRIGEQLPRAVTLAIRLPAGN